MENTRSRGQFRHSRTGELARLYALEGVVGLVHTHDEGGCCCVCKRACRRGRVVLAWACLFRALAEVVALAVALGVVIAAVIIAVVIVDIEIGVDVAIDVAGAAATTPTTETLGATVSLSLLPPLVVVVAVVSFGAGPFPRAAAGRLGRARNEGAEGPPGTGEDTFKMREGGTGRMLMCLLAPLVYCVRNVLHLEVGGTGVAQTPKTPNSCRCTGAGSAVDGLSTNALTDWCIPPRVSGGPRSGICAGRRYGASGRP